MDRLARMRYVLACVAAAAFGGSVVLSASAAQELSQRPPVQSEPAPGVTLPEVEPLDVEGDIVAVGSSTVLPLVQALYTRFIQEGYRGVMRIDSIGTGAGLRLFCEKLETDIAMSSRHITPKESEACVARGRKPVPFHLGVDALAVGQQVDGVAELGRHQRAVIDAQRRTARAEKRLRRDGEDLQGRSPRTCIASCWRAKRASDSWRQKASGCRAQRRSASSTVAAGRSRRLPIDAWRRWSRSSGDRA